MTQDNRRGHDSHQGWTIVMVSAFGDESADETQQRTFAVAAVAASDEEWTQLEGAWQERKLSPV
jgi:hypothetical protein